MATNLKVCEIDESLIQLFKKFRFRKDTNNAAIVMKIDTSNLLVVLDDEYEDMTPDELRAELPEHQPRYVLFSYCYHHDDGRISYPQVYIHIHPEGCKPELAMMYSGSNNSVVQAIGATKHFELRDLDEFTEEWMRQKLKFFR